MTIAATASSRVPDAMKVARKPRPVARNAPASGPMKPPTAEIAALKPKMAPRGDTHQRLQQRELPGIAHECHRQVNQPRCQETDRQHAAMTGAVSQPAQ